MTSPNRLLSFVTSSAIVALFLFGGLSHALIAHDHGDTPGEHAIWQSLHSAVHHEKQPLVVTTVIALAISVLVASHFIRLISRLLYLREVQQLRRGIHKYRRFG